MAARTAWTRLVNFGEHAVARGVDHAAVVQIDDRVDDGPVRGEEAQRPLLVRFHEPGVSGHVGGEDRGELALDRGAQWLSEGAILAQVYLFLDDAAGSGWNVRKRSPHQEGRCMKTYLAGPAGLIIALVSLGCVVETPPPRPVVVAPPPAPVVVALPPQPEVIVETVPPIPPPRQEVVVVRPSPAHVWVGGHWAWRPAARAYIWVPGVWVVPASPRHVWVPAHWARRPGGYVWVEGHWR